MPELVISPREVTRGRANLVVGQLSGGQPARSAAVGIA